MSGSEYLAEMLGVRRASVTKVAHTLQAVGLIKYSRGKIQILNAPGPQNNACECYGRAPSDEMSAGFISLGPGLFVSSFSWLLSATECALPP
jgi:Crp-like helix-turn-helix domain